MSDDALPRAEDDPGGEGVPAELRSRIYGLLAHSFLSKPSETTVHLWLDEDIGGALVEAMGDGTWVGSADSRPIVQDDGALEQRRSTMFAVRAEWAEKGIEALHSDFADLFVVPVPGRMIAPYRSRYVRRDAPWGSDMGLSLLYERWGLQWQPGFQGEGEPFLWAPDHVGLILAFLGAALTGPEQPAPLRLADVGVGGLNWEILNLTGRELERVLLGDMAAWVPGLCSEMMSRSRTAYFRWLASLISEWVPKALLLLV